jgi:protein-S-isoprenylcysteine O-methyltransferase Ste14
LTFAELGRRLRLPLGFGFAVVYLLLARPTPLALIVGVAVAFGGLLVRAWAAGHIVKNDRLAMTGPYAHTRNPLYFGSFLIAAGFAIAAHWSLLLIVIALFALIYAPTIEHERTKINAMFPAEYPTYAANVPAFVPRVRAWRPPGTAEPAPFSFELYMKHREWRAALAFFAVVTYLAARLRYDF